jgi:hypothetical protein
MALSLTIHLSDSEEQLLKDIAREVNPGASNVFLKDWAQAVAKTGLRDELGTIQLDLIRQAENTNRAAEKDQFAASFPEVVLPEPEAPEPPVEE